MNVFRIAALQAFLCIVILGCSRASRESVRKSEDTNILVSSGADGALEGIVQALRAAPNLGTISANDIEEIRLVALKRRQLMVVGLVCLVAAAALFCTHFGRTANEDLDCQITAVYACYDQEADEVRVQLDVVLKTHGAAQLTIRPEIQRAFDLRPDTNLALVLPRLRSHRRTRRTAFLRLCSQRCQLILRRTRFG